MTGGRVLILLITTATGLLAAALYFTGAESAGTAVAGAGIAATSQPPMSQILADTLGSISRSELTALLVGVCAGWLLRWLYALPWGALPRAVGNWLLGWRMSAAMVGLAVGCTVILLFY